MDKSLQDIYDSCNEELRLAEEELQRTESLLTMTKDFSPEQLLYCEINL